jgi:hypothetical protein
MKPVRHGSHAVRSDALLDAPPPAHDPGGTAREQQPTQSVVLPAGNARALFMRRS